MKNEIANGKSSRKRFTIPKVWIALVAIYIFSSFFSPVFSISQIRNILRVASFLGTVAIGQTFVIITGGLDLSVGGLITTTSVLSCVIMNGDDKNIFIAIVICISMGLLVGITKGLLITKLKIIPMIATLAMNSIVFGTSLVITNGVQKGRAAPRFEAIGDGMFIGIPKTFCIFFIFAALMVFLTNRTKIGKEIYATGANKAAAYVAGINDNKSIIIAHVICSFSAVLTGLLLTSYTGLSSFDVGDPYTMTSIASAVIGGSLMSGGVGTVLGSMGGALFMTVLNTITNVLQMSSGAQNFIRGLIIIIGVVSSGSVVSKMIKDQFRVFKHQNMNTGGI